MIMTLLKKCDIGVNDDTSKAKNSGDYLNTCEDFTNVPGIAAEP